MIGGQLEVAIAGPGGDFCSGSMSRRSCRFSADLMRTFCCLRGQGKEPWESAQLAGVWSASDGLWINNWRSHVQSCRTEWSSSGASNEATLASSAFSVALNDALQVVSASKNVTFGYLVQYRVLQSHVPQRTFIHIKLRPVSAEARP